MWVLYGERGWESVHPFAVWSFSSCTLRKVCTRAKPFRMRGLWVLHKDIGSLKDDMIEFTNYRLFSMASSLRLSGCFGPVSISMM